MIMSGDHISTDQRAELAMKVFTDLHKGREKTVRGAILTHVKGQGLGQFMTTGDWINIENRVVIAFIALHEYVPELGERR